MSELKAFLDKHPNIILIRVKEAKGSTPRGTDALMLVSETGSFGTIGGGQLEFLAIKRARAILDDEQKEGRWSQPLGPGIGQCCGGHVTLGLERVSEKVREELISNWHAAEDALPHVHIFGAGHVGRALARALQLLPVRTKVIETREDELAQLEIAHGEGRLEVVLSPIPEHIVRAAPAGSAFVVLTHDHALDFMITSEALTREDAAYVGLIGSATKKELFRRQFLENGGTRQQYEKLVCPIGGNTMRDKRPEVIAALTAAEIMQRLLE